MGRKKKADSIKHLIVDFTDLADLAAEREQAEGVLMQANTVPAEVMVQHGPGLLAEVGERAAKVAERSSAAASKAKAAYAPLCQPLIDLYDAISKTIRGRLGMPPEEIAAAAGADVDPITGYYAADNETWDITVTSEAAIPRQLLCLDRSLLGAYLDHHHKAGNAPEVPGITYARKAGR